MTPKFNKVHYRFKLNNLHFSHEALKEVAYSYVKEGKPYEQVLGDFLIDWLDNETHIDVKTSGSTGAPKRIQLSKQAMVNSALATGDFFRLKPGDRALHCLPTNFIAGKMMLVRAMILGLEIDVVQPTAQPIFDYNINYDFCAMIPLQLKNTHTYLDSIKLLITGGAVVSDTLKASIQSIKTEVYETYGMTETVTHVAVKPINKVACLKQNLGEGSNESYFQILPNITISQDDRDCLIIDAPNLSTSKIITNDVVKLHSDAAFEWLGRIDNVINSGGLKLFPEQIEAKLRPHIDARFFIAAQKDDTLGEKVILIIEGETYILKASIFRHLEKNEIPKMTYFVSQFSETVSGKVQRPNTLDLIK